VPAWQSLGNPRAEIGSDSAALAGCCTGSPGTTGFHNTARTYRRFLRIRRLGVRVPPSALKSQVTGLGRHSRRALPPVGTPIGTP
jgi:hypothetical protein